MALEHRTIIDNSVREIQIKLTPYLIFSRSKTSFSKNTKSTEFQIERSRIP